MIIDASNKNIPDIYEKDIQFCIDNINQEPIEFWRRSLIRLCVSLFESETHLLKNHLIKYSHKNKIPLSPEVILMLRGKKFTLGDNGKLKESYASNKLIDEIKFTFNQFFEIRGFSLAVDFKDNGWKNLKETIKIRNRITHPKSYIEQTISVNEIEICMSGYNWFYENFVNLQKQEIQLLENEISKYEKAHRLG